MPSLSDTNNVGVVCPGIGFDNTVWDGGYLRHKVLYASDSFVYMTVYDLEIKN